MKKAAGTLLKCVVFFLGWAIFVSVLPLPDVENPVVWRFFAELMPLLAMVMFTYIFWRAERRSVNLHLVGAPLKGICFGMAMGVLWLGLAVGCMFFLGIIGFDGINDVDFFVLWMAAVFLNVVMQELLVRGYLYQMIKQKHNAVVAAAATTGLFTALHGGAFEAGLVPVLNVLAMSLLMTVVLEFCGSIIAPIMMHFVWNGVGALVLGGVSLAADYPHLLNMVFSGNELLSGGICKVEGSVLVLVVNVVLWIAVALAGRRQRRLNAISDIATDNIRAE